MEEKLEAIEYLEPPKRKHTGESYGGTIVIYRLKLMTREQIEAHGLMQYVAEKGGEEDEEQ